MDHMMHMGMGGGGTSKAIEWLKKAIELHEDHMTGEAPTDEASQAELMMDLENALAGLMAAGPQMEEGMMGMGGMDEMEEDEDTMPRKMGSVR